MKIKKHNQGREKIISLLLRIIDKLDNSGNSDFRVNGEEIFISNIVKYYENKNLTVFDVGANIGEYSFMVNEQASKSVNLCIHLFEPQKACFEELKNKFQNNIGVFLNNYGLSDRNEIMRLYKDSEKSGLSSLYKRNLDFFGIKMEMFEEVHLKVARDYVENNKINRINLLKVDVEGHELNVLAGFDKYLNSDFIDFIQFEYGGANVDSHTNLMDFFKLLIPKGFRLCKIMPNYLEIRDYNPRFDNFGYQNYVAISERILADLMH